MGFRWGKFARQGSMMEIEDSMPKLIIFIMYMVQVKFSGKPTLRRSLMCRKFISGYLQEGRKKGDQTRSE
jgi:hypothetical protein